MKFVFSVLKSSKQGTTREVKLLPLALTSIRVNIISPLIDPIKWHVSYTSKQILTAILSACSACERKSASAC